MGAANPGTLSTAMMSSWTRYSAMSLCGLAICIIAFFVSCNTSQSGHGPQLIEADGKTYTACGGALWLHDDKNVKDPATWSYEVIFADAAGVRHDLKRVRVLKVTDLPAGTSACNRSY
jgi:hypothetical protein